MVAKRIIILLGVFLYHHTYGNGAIISGCQADYYLPNNYFPTRVKAQISEQKQVSVTWCVFSQTYLCLPETHRCNWPACGCACLFPGFVPDPLAAAHNGDAEASPSSLDPHFPLAWWSPAAPLLPNQSIIWLLIKAQPGADFWVIYAIEQFYK